MITGLMTDLHGTLLNSNYAWIEALKEINPKRKDFYEKMIWEKKSRKELATIAGVKFEELIKVYKSKLRIRPEVVELVSVLSKTYPIVIVSNAERKRIEEDLVHLKSLPIQKIFSKECGSKPNRTYLESILTMMKWNKAFLIGNDLEEDYIQSDRIISIIIPYKKYIK